MTQHGQECFCLALSVFPVEGVSEGTNLPGLHSAGSLNNLHLVASARADTSFMGESRKSRC